MDHATLRKLAEDVLSEEWDPWDGTQGFEPTREQKAYMKAASPEVVLTLLDGVTYLSDALDDCQRGKAPR